MEEQVVYELGFDYSYHLEEIINLNNLIVEQLGVLESVNQALINLNGYFYLLIFGLAGVGLFYLFYRFLKIFI